MRRKTFDALATAVGLALAVVLLIAGGLLLWGHNFVNTQVHNQLVAQKIFFPANNIKAIGGGQTYAQLSTKAQLQPKNVALAGQVATMFKGETLRGLLLNAYAFGEMGMLAGIAAIVAFAGAGVLLILSGLGIAHLRRVPVEAEIFAKVVTPNGKTPTRTPVTTS